MCKSKVEGALPPHLKSWVGTCPHCPHGCYATAVNCVAFLTISCWCEMSSTAGANWCEFSLHPCKWCKFGPSPVCKIWQVLTRSHRGMGAVSTQKLGSVFFSFWGRCRHKNVHNMYIYIYIYIYIYMCVYI